MIGQKIRKKMITVTTSNSIFRKGFLVWNIMIQMQVVQKNSWMQQRRKLRIPSCYFCKWWWWGKNAHYEIEYKCQSCRSIRKWKLCYKNHHTKQRSPHLFELWCLGTKQGICIKRGLDFFWIKIEILGKMFKDIE